MQRANAKRKIGFMTQTIKTGMMGAALALALGIMACSPATADAGHHHKSDAMPAPTGAVGVHPISGLKVIPLAIATKSGTHQFRVEVAVTGEEQEKGLMFRTAMGADQGMIFPMDPPRMAAFWMKNTVIPLDIIFIGPNHRVLNVAADAVPYDLTPLPSTGPAAAVLELNGGRAAQIGLKPGDKIAW